VTYTEDGGPTVTVLSGSIMASKATVKQNGDGTCPPLD